MTDNMETFIAWAIYLTAAGVAWWVASRLAVRWRRTWARLLYNGFSALILFTPAPAVPGGDHLAPAAAVLPLSWMQNRMDLVESAILCLLAGILVLTLAGVIQLYLQGQRRHAQAADSSGADSAELPAGRT